MVDEDGYAGSYSYVDVATRREASAAGAASR
jgi:hypothetical protein